MFFGQLNDKRKNLVFFVIFVMLLLVVYMFCLKEKCDGLCRCFLEFLLYVSFYMIIFGIRQFFFRDVEQWRLRKMEILFDIFYIYFNIYLIMYVCLIYIFVNVKFDSVC